MAAPKRVPPHNLEAEMSLLGACLLSAQARDDVMPLVAVKDFYKPAHQTAFNTIRTLHQLGKPVDAVIVAEALRQDGSLDDVGGMEFLSNLMQEVPVTSNAERYADIVSQTAQQREIIKLSGEAMDAAYAEMPLGETIAETKAKLDEVDMAGRTQVSVVGGVEFMASPADDYDWVMEHVMERDDRLLITGGEGARKSLLLLQWAVMSASGVHWMVQSRVKPRRVLFLDLELGRKRTRRRVNLFSEEGDWSHEKWAENLVIHSRSDDIDITTRAGASYLASIFDVAQPDIAFIGPIYRLVSGVAKAGDIGGEDQAKRAAFALDKIRERFNCALVCETHAAKGEAGRGRDLRPFGSATWLRWPEFGYGLVRQSPDATAFDINTREWVGWRGDRDPREWPDRFTWAVGKGWPLSAQYDNTPAWWHSMMKGNTSSTKVSTGPVVHPDNLIGF